MKKTFKGGLLRSTMMATAISLGGLAPAMIATTANAQDYTTGLIRGEVLTTYGVPVVGAVVNLQSNRGSSRTVTTNSNGEFQAPRLAIGAYTVTVNAPGFAPLEDQTVMSSLGATNSYTFTVASDSDEDVVVATGTVQRGFDFQSTTGGISVNIDDIVETIPVGRNLTSIALLAPGTTQGDSTFGNLASFSGSSVAENVQYVNGLNISEYRNFLGASTVPFDFVEQTEIKTSGYGAEFGRATGGVINSVTRSGTNEFQVGANFYYSPDWLRAEANNTTTNLNNFESRDSQTTNVWASGPIIKDKLFFAGIYEWSESDSDTYTVNSRAEFSSKNEFWGAKIDFEPISGHRFEATLFSDEGESRTQNYDSFAGGQNIDFNGIGDVTIPLDNIQDLSIDTLSGPAVDGQTVNKSGGLNQIYKYTGVMTDWLTISAQYGENPRDLTSFSEPDTSGLKRIIDSRDPGNPFTPVAGFATSTTFGSDSDLRKAYRVDADLYFNAFGKHHVRVGVDREDLRSVSSTQVSGGQYWRYYTCRDGDTLSDGVSTGCIFPEGEIAQDSLFVRDWIQSGGGSFDIEQTAQYIQDEWEITDDLTLLLGLRNETFDNKNPNGDSFIKASNQLAPRLGFTWDPSSIGLTDSRIFGSYGRNFLPIAGNTNLRQSSAATFILNYYPTLGPDATWEPLAVGGGLVDKDVDPSLWIRTFDDGVLPNPATITSLDLKPMFQDEWTLGYEKNFGNGWNFGVLGIYRDLKSIIEDVGVDHALAAWGLRNNKDQAVIDDLLDPSTSLTYINHNPGGDLRFLSDAFTTDGSVEEVLLTAEDLGYPEAKRTYTALEFTGGRAFDGKWGIDGSYTLSWAEGNTEGSVNSDLGQDDAGLTQDFDIPATLIGADGYTANDRRHRLKVRGTYQLVDEVRLGSNFTVESPRSFGCFGNLPQGTQVPSAFGDTNIEENFEYHNRYGADYWFCDGEVSPRGENFDGDWTVDLDLSMRITPSFNENIPGDVSFHFDVFNVLNNQSVSERIFAKELDRTSAAADIDQNYFYAQPSTLAAPRSVRFSAKYRY